MIKILILLAIVGLTTYIGVILSSGKKKRMQVFAELYEFNEQLILNLKFSRDSINKIAEKFRFIPKILSDEKVLGDKDWEIIKDYSVNLGKSDVSSQIDYLSGRKSALSKLKDESLADYKRYSSLYVKIFFMIGVLIAVLLA